MLAAFLLMAPVSAAAQQKPIEIGALALGPRSVPTWRCTPAQYGPASAERRQETMPFSVLVGDGMNPSLRIEQFRQKDWTRIGNLWLSEQSKLCSMKCRNHAPTAARSDKQSQLTFIDADIDRMLSCGHPIDGGP
jgi:hypothetical protein